MTTAVFPEGAAADPGVAMLTRFIDMDRKGTILGGVLVPAIIALFVVNNPGLWVVVAVHVLHVALLTLALRQLSAETRGRAVVAIAVGNWLIAVVVVALMPFMLPVMVLIALRPLVLAIPHMDADQLIWSLAAAAFFIGVIAIVGITNDDGGIFEDIDDSIELVLVVGGLAVTLIPLVLTVWQNHGIYAKALEAETLLNQELRQSQLDVAASRRRIVEVADRERNRLERDLHDGAQQRLVSVALTLRAAQAKADGDQAERLGVVHGELTEAINELRELAHGIYPPVLQLQGLSDAIAEAARRSATSVTFESTTANRYDVSIEAALYFVALEALTNVAKHAPDAAAYVKMFEEPVDGANAVHVVIRDDGPGFNADQHGDSNGLTNMADRIASVGGTLAIDTTPGGGTELRVTVPLTASTIGQDPTT
jgi:signal transduction histidine kinase